ncbi:Arylsulfatase [Pontiella desulfatans]|uniref:Arylsulfatase n=1 Tax=Pontiella desulfatans TaxID=2750659 RepID=A0A6C2U7J6_PONDE|nr:sulfatase-like hydrolase/transferase [Pontiella desulfatans]SPS73971.1 sulfatase S1_16 [Kiritimatiellales bacterium]VGO15404.1 Arylsulfatase [Pontiella desulfatans]
MKRRGFIQTLGIAAAAGNGYAAKKKKPNVVFILIDDMGWKDLGCFGAKLYETPNIDRLCAEGIRFPQAYTSTAICSPARATALTGLHPMKMQMWNHMHYLPQGQKILPQYLKEAGYQNWHVGKWHIGNEKLKSLPTNLGFDANIGGWSAWGPGSYFWPYLWNGKAHNRNSVPMLNEGGKEGEQLTDRLTDEALKLIDGRNPGQPFYLNYWLYSVHNKKEAKKELIQKYERKIKAMGLERTVRHDPKTGKDLVTSETNAKYAAMLETVDTNVGRILEKLKAIGEYDNTLFIFFSDNGSTTDDVPCAPLNGGKNSTYEAGVRVPAFMAWNGRIQPGGEYNRSIYIGDVFNTVMEATGQTPPETDSRSLLPVFAGKQLPPREYVWYFPDTREKWGQRANAAIYDEKSGMKYLMFFNGDEDELYNLNQDIGETTNLIEQQPETAQALQNRLVQFLKQNMAGTPPPPEKYKASVEQRLGLSLHKTD